VRLDDLAYIAVDDVVDWRNEVRESLRTSGISTTDRQLKFCNSLKGRDDIRYYAVLEDKHPVPEEGPTIDAIGVGGLVNIQWDNSIAEVALLLNPRFRGKHLGEAVVDMLLEEAFDNMGLRTVYGECYFCSPAKTFWHRLIEKNKWYATVLPKRKMWNGRLYDSIYFSIDAEPIKYAPLILEAGNSLPTGIFRPIQNT